MRSYGDLDLQQNELQQAVFPVEENFPSLPKVGRLVFKDSVLYICIDIATGTPVWIPLTNEIQAFNYTQSSSSNSWVITHNLNTTLPSVQIYGPDNKVVFPDNIEVISNNVVKVTFGSQMTGRAAIIAGTRVGNTTPNYAFNFTQTTLSSTWVIVHNLGYNPIVRVFIGNSEVQPDTIFHDSLFQTTITFTTPQMGVARLI